MANKEFDLVVIGSGPGGYIAAIRAGQLGMKTAIVEKTELGGVCLNWGCIPTKALLRSSDIYHHAKHGEPFGIKVDGISFDIIKMVSHSRRTAKQLSKGVGFLMKKNKVEIVEGHGQLDGKQDGKHKVSVQKGDKDVAVLSAKNVILASGARARVIPGIEPDGEMIWTYREAMVPKSMPKSILVIGSGAIGIEFASFYHSLGAEVTVVEVLDRILPVEDKDVSALARKSFEKNGMNILTSATVKSVKKDTKKGQVTAVIEAQGKTREITVEKIISAVGIVGNVENLGLDGTNIKVERTHVVTDAYGFTGEAGVYAIGDLTGAPWLAHKASHEGVIAVEKIAGMNTVHPLDTSKIPACTFCTPQIASIGMTEQQARDGGHTIKVGNFPFLANGKAVALRETEGFTKTIFDSKTGQLLGAHMIGPEVTEMIQGFSIAMTLETTEAELMQSVFPHPTVSESMHEAVLDAYDKALNF